MGWSEIQTPIRTTPAQVGLSRCQYYLMCLNWMTAALVACWPLCASDQAPSDVHLIIGVTKAVPTYRLGERIILKMSFSTPNPGRYKLQRNGEPRDIWDYIPEVFSVSPSDGATDPHVALSRELGLPIGGSTLMGNDRFRPDPTILQTDLNEWVRFVKPGVYRISARSSRVSLGSEPGSSLSPRHPLTLDSNEIQVSLLPAESKWAANELDDITKSLDSTASTDDEKSIAAARLRYLNTKSSVVKLIRELPETTDEPCHWELVEGLIESSWRKEAIALLRQSLNWPEERVSWDAVDLLTKLTLLERYQYRKLDYEAGSPEQVKTLQAAIKERRDRYPLVRDRYTAELKASLPTKRGRARRDALFAVWKDQESDSREFSAERLALMRHEIVSIASELSPGQQSWLISNYWQNLPDHQSLLPLVKRIALSNESSPMTFKTRNLRAAAMQRWCEMDAEGCRVR